LRSPNHGDLIRLTVTHFAQHRKMPVLKDARSSSIRDKYCNPEPIALEASIADTDSHVEPKTTS